MANAETFVPKGFTAGRNPMISEALGARLNRLPRRSGPQRLLAVAAPGATKEALDEFLAQDGLWAPRRKAPGIYEVNVLPDDIARFTERKDLFTLLDVGTRLFGKVVPEGATMVGVELALRSEPAKLHFKKVPPQKLVDLLKDNGVEAIEVK